MGLRRVQGAEQNAVIYLVEQIWRAFWGNWKCQTRIALQAQPTKLASIDTTTKVGPNRFNTLVHPVLNKSFMIHEAKHYIGARTNSALDNYKWKKPALFFDRGKDWKTDQEWPNVIWGRLSFSDIFEGLMQESRAVRRPRVPTMQYPYITEKWGNAVTRTVGASSNLTLLSSISASCQCA